MACRLYGAKPLSEPMLGISLMGTLLGLYSILMVTNCIAGAGSSRVPHKQLWSENKHKPNYINIREACGSTKTCGTRHMYQARQPVFLGWVYDAKFYGRKLNFGLNTGFYTGERSLHMKNKVRGHYNTQTMALCLTLMNSCHTGSVMPWHHIISSCPYSA